MRGSGVLQRGGLVAERFADFADRVHNSPAKLFRTAGYAPIGPSYRDGPRSGRLPHESGADAGVPFWDVGKEPRVGHIQPAAQATPWVRR
jgi:hypothetical protein